MFVVVNLNNIIIDTFETKENIEKLYDKDKYLIKDIELSKIEFDQNILKKYNPKIHIKLLEEHINLNNDLESCFYIMQLFNKKFKDVHLDFVLDDNYDVCYFVIVLDKGIFDLEEYTFWNKFTLDETFSNEFYFFENELTKKLLKYNVKM